MGITVPNINPSPAWRAVGILCSQNKIKPTNTSWASVMCNCVGITKLNFQTHHVTSHTHGFTLGVAKTYIGLPLPLLFHSSSTLGPNVCSSQKPSPTSLKLVTSPLNSPNTLYCPLTHHHQLLIHVAISAAQLGYSSSHEICLAFPHVT